MLRVRTERGCTWEAGNVEGVTLSLHGLGKKSDLPKTAKSSISGDVKIWRHKLSKGHPGG